ncbi:histidine phosphatase family protein [Peptoniphilus sp. oral taxon 386]|uniref:histidine phosphatase family protein n=1 Tax=Peptoniphilus sp. oral taxon 386 TaxID=652713 RepID=UPI0001DA9CD2|nr:histidine phosphatase family protein [Peptoniphilus sp. oral taxon 386]EFI42677.1 phosphoglycerate mutase family protein [Peptoniphilus sp. oral taxon 386 str. F0131]
MKIYFTRHGQTYWNRENRIQGHLDSPLTEDGIKMAYSLKEQSKDVKFDHIYSSDLGRAYETAKIIAGERDIIQTKLLREINVGSWSGELFEDIKFKDKELYGKYFNEPQNYYRADGESIHDLNDRIQKFFKSYVYESNDENILIVSHGITIISILNLIEGVGIDKFWTNRVRRNAKFNIASYENGEFKMLVKAPKNEIMTI